MSLAQLWDEWIAKARQHRVNEIVIGMSSEWQFHLLLRGKHLKSKGKWNLCVEPVVF